jgi:hypothetical protein
MTTITPIDLDQRQRLSELLDERSAGDAAAAYYALDHPSDKTRLYAVASNHGSPKGFLVVARTGLDLFRPLLVPFVGQATALLALVRQVLPQVGPSILRLPFHQLAWLDGAARIENLHHFDVLQLAPEHYDPTLNVLVVESDTPDGGPRYEVHTADGQQASAGLNWLGPRFAEIYLQASPNARDRRLTRSVLSAIVGRLLGERRTPLYIVESTDPVSRTEAFQLGFRPTRVEVAVVDVQAADPKLTA